MGDHGNRLAIFSSKSIFDNPHLGRGLSQPTPEPATLVSLGRSILPRSSFRLGRRRRMHAGVRAAMVLALAVPSCLLNLGSGSMPTSGSRASPCLGLPYAAGGAPPQLIRLFGRGEIPVRTRHV